MAVKENNGTGGWLIANDSDQHAGLADRLWLSRFRSQAPYLFNLAETKSTFDYLEKPAGQGMCLAWQTNNARMIILPDRYTLIYSGSLADIASSAGIPCTRAGNTDQWVLIPYPVKIRYPTMTLVDGMDYFIIKSDAVHQMAAWLFLRWMNEQDQQVRLSQVQLVLAEPFFGGERRLRLITHRIWFIPMCYRAMDTIQPVPHAAEWNIVRRIFEDATWQLFPT